MAVDYRFGKPTSNISKEKLFKLLAKYPMPRQKDAFGNDIPFAENNATLNMQINYALNCERIEQERKLKPKQMEAQRLEMERVEKQQREQRERELETARRLPEVQFRSFADGKRYTCGYCHVGLRYEAVCKNPNCPAHSSVSIEPLMSKLREFVNDYYKSKNKKSSKEKQQPE